MASVLEVGLYDYSNEAFNYVGNWGYFTKGTEKMTYSEIAGNYVEFTFNGTGFNWYTHINAWRGYAKIYIDDIEKTKVDLYSKDEINNVMIYSSDKMENTNHKVKIIVDGEKKSLSVAYKVVIYKIEILKEEIVDYSEMIKEKEAELIEKEEQLAVLQGISEKLPSEIDEIKQQIVILNNAKDGVVKNDILVKGTYNNNYSSLKYSGTWGTFIKDNETMIYSETKGDKVEFYFYGTGFKWYTHTNPWRGYAKIYLDDVELKTVNLYSDNEINNVLIYSQEQLESNVHKVKIEVLANGNKISKAYKIVIYKMEILDTVTASEYDKKIEEKEKLLVSTTGKIEELQNEIEQLQNEIENLKVLQGEEIVEVTDLQVDDENIILYKAETHQLTWTVIPENATDKTVKFESGNTGFVTVTDTGLLTYVNEGETNINLTTSNNITKSVRVICKETNEENPDENNNIFQEDNDNTDYSKAVESENLYDEGIIIANEAEVLEIGDMIKIIAHVLPYSVYNTNPYVLKSSDESIVKVKGGKVIEAVSVGKAVITAYTTDGKYKNSVEYNVINKTEKTIDISKIYSLELDKFEIVADVSTKEQAIKNSDGIKSALYYAVNNGYEKIVFPSNLTIYIEPSETIYMESNLIVDLNNCIIKLRPNNYERYSAFYFGQGNGLNLVDNNFFNFSDAKYVDDFDPFNNITAKNPMYYKIFDFTSNNTITQYSKKIQIYSKSNKFNKLFDSLHYGDSINFSFRQLRYGNYSMNIQLQYYKDDTLILEESSKVVSNSWTFSTPSFTFNLRNTVDYNNIQFKFVFTKSANSTDSSYSIYYNNMNLNWKAKDIISNCKLCNGTIYGERDEKSNVYPNWYNIGSTEGGCSIIFYEGANNGIENLTVKKSIGFNMSSGKGDNSYGVTAYSQTPITYKVMELGTLDDKGENLSNSNYIRTSEFIDISKIKTSYYDIGYPLGYHGYPYVNSRIYDVCFYDINKQFIRRDRGLLRFRQYNKPENAYYAKFVFYNNYVPTSGNSDFNGAFAFVENFAHPIKNYIRNCVIEDNYSCGFAACGGQKWRIANNTWRRNAGRMPGCDIDWEDGWEYMQDDLIEGNSFESYNTCILCAGAGQVFYNNKFNGIATVYGRSQYWSFIENIIEDTVGITSGNGAKLSLGSSTDCYLENNIYNKSSIAWGANHGVSQSSYDLYVKNEKFTDSNVLNSNIRSIKYSYFKGSNFSLCATKVIKCNLESGIVSTNSNFSNSNLKSITIRPAKDSQVIFGKCNLINCSIEPMYNCKDVLIKDSIITREKVGNIIAPSSNSTGGVEVTDSNFIFEKIDDYHYIVGGWNATGCSAVYTFNNCKMTLYDGFKGYLIKCSWYADGATTTHVTLNFNNTDVSKFEKTDAKGLKSNIVFNIK